MPAARSGASYLLVTLPKSLPLEELRYFLSVYSPVEDVSLIVDPVTRQPKGTLNFVIYAQDAHLFM